jgi:hypothetical protein
VGTTKRNPKPGRYRHYKGQDYYVIGCATHTETKEQLVVYRALYANEELWVRPLSMFTESITLPDGKRVPRFKNVESIHRR